MHDTGPYPRLYYNTIGTIRVTFPRSWYNNVAPGGRPTPATWRHCHRSGVRIMTMGLAIPGPEALSPEYRLPMHCMTMVLGARKDYTGGKRVDGDTIIVELEVTGSTCGWMMDTLISTQSTIGHIARFKSILDPHLYSAVRSNPSCRPRNATRVRSMRKSA